MGKNVLNVNVRDPELTPKGLKLASSLSIPNELLDVESPDITIVSSPLKRCLQTVLLAYADYCRRKGLKIYVWDLLQGGRSDQPCLIGSPVSDLKKAFRDYLDILDFSDLEENTGYTSDDRKLSRAEVMQLLRERLSKVYSRTIIISAHT